MVAAVAQTLPLRRCDDDAVLCAATDNFWQLPRPADGVCKVRAAAPPGAARLLASSMPVGHLAKHWES